MPTLAAAVPPPPADRDDDSVDEDTDSGLAPPPKPSPARRRSDSDMRTGKNQIAEATDPGDEPASDPGDEPGLASSEPLRANTDAEGNAISEHTAQTLMAPEPPRRRLPDDLLKAVEQNPKTPIPTMDRRIEPAPPPRVVHVPISTAPSSLPPPKQLEATPSGPSPACPQCEAPMSWVDEHLRFYCRQCRMYF